MRDSAENRFASQVVEASMKEAVVESSKANFDDEASYSTHQVVTMVIMPLLLFLTN